MNCRSYGREVCALQPGGGEIDRNKGFADALTRLRDGLFHARAGGREIIIFQRGVCYRYYVYTRDRWTVEKFTNGEIGWRRGRLSPRATGWKGARVREGRIREPRPSGNVCHGPARAYTLTI